MKITQEETRARYNELMLWVYLTVSFAIWIAYIIAMRKKVAHMRDSLGTLTRGRRVFYMLACLVISFVVLLGGGMLVMYLGWLDEKGLNLFGFFTVTLIGLGFVHLQMYATGLTLSLAFDSETSSMPNASEKEGTKLKSGEDK
jgi:hypothetical protein